MTIQAADFQCGDFKPRLRLSRFRAESVFHRLVPGRRFYLHRSDGTRLTTLLDAVSVEGIAKEAYSNADDATLYSFPCDPTIQLRFKLRITDSLAPPGTEIWLIE
jgi:hypothetical protein